MKGDLILSVNKLTVLHMLFLGFSKQVEGKHKKMILLTVEWHLLKLFDIVCP